MKRSGTIDFPADDGAILAGTLFEGDGNGPAVLLSSAAAVDRRFYRSFAEALIEAGASAVLTYDYRGVGGSRDAGSRSARMKEWGTLDFPGALAALRAAVPGKAVTGIGHSFGGLAIGLSGKASGFERYVMLASLNGYFRRTGEPFSIFARMNLIGVPLTYLLGRLPAGVGLGTGLPGRVFRDWARWCRHPDFLFADPSVPEAARFREVEGDILSIGIADDRWGTPAAVSALLGRLTNARVRELWLGPRPGEGPVGHLGFFRRGNSALWPPVIEHILSGTIPAGATPVSV